MLKKIHLKLFFVISFFVVSHVFSQTSEIDSLLLKISVSGNDTGKVNLLNKLGNKLRSSDPDKASVYLQQSYLLSKKLGFIKGTANSLFNTAVIKKNQGNYKTALDLYFESMLSFQDVNDSNGIALNLNGIGLVYMYRAIYDSALLCMQQSLNIRQALGDKKNIAGSLNNIGLLFMTQGNYEKALVYYMKSAIIRYLIDDKAEMAGSYNNIGSILYHQGKYTKALGYFQKALQIDIETGNKRDAAADLNNIAGIFYQQKNYENSLEYYFKSYELCKDLSDKAGIAGVLGNIGLIYERQENYDSAIDYFSQALKKCQEIENKEGVAIELYRIGSILNKQGYYSESIANIEKSILLAKELKLIDVLKKGYENLSEAYDSIGNISKAYESYKLYVVMKDSVFDIESNNKMTELQTKYETEKKEKENKLLEKEKEVKELELAKKQNQLFSQRLLFAAVIIVIVFLSLVIYILYRNKAIRKRNKLQQELNLYMQKALSQQMNPHFIFNTVNSIQYYILNNDKVASNKYLTMFARLMRMTLENSQHHLIPIQDEIQALNLYLELESLRFEGKFEYGISIDEENEVELFKMPTLLIQPYVENSIWHGLMHKDGMGKISVDIALMENKVNSKNLMVKCTIEDNGIGREKATEIKQKKNTSHKSLGTKITENRLRLINSLYGSDMSVNYTDLKDENGNPTGTRVEICFPVLE